MRILRGDSDASLGEAEKVIAGGGVVALPTDTFYGLAVNPFDHDALERLIALKGRGEDKGILLLLSNIAMALPFASSVPDALVASGLWPGPVTVLCAAAPSCDSLLTGGTGRIGLRIPRAPAVTGLCDRLGHAVTGTSANRAGAAPARCIDDLDAIRGGVDLALDGGRLHAETPSTVVDLTGPAPTLVRAGAVSLEWIVDRLGGRRGGTP